jgi:hypothetical protein
VLDRTYQFEVSLKTPEREESQTYVADLHRGGVADSSSSLLKSMQPNDPSEEISASHRTSVWGDRASTVETSMVFIVKSKAVRDLWVSRLADLLQS